MVLPDLPDLDLFDKIYILPVFARPGKHSYVIKYKDTNEETQKRLLNRTQKIKRREKKAGIGRGEPVSEID